MPGVTILLRLPGTRKQSVPSYLPWIRLLERSYLPTPFMPSGVPGPFLAMQLRVTFPRRAPSCWPGLTSLGLLPPGAAEEEENIFWGFPKIHLIFNNLKQGNVHRKILRCDFGCLTLKGILPHFEWLQYIVLPPLPFDVSPLATVQSIYMNTIPKWGTTIA